MYNEYKLLITTERGSAVGAGVTIATSIAEFPTEEAAEKALQRLRSASDISSTYLKRYVLRLY